MLYSRHRFYLAAETAAMRMPISLQTVEELVYPGLEFDEICSLKFSFINIDYSFKLSCEVTI